MIVQFDDNVLYAERRAATRRRCATVSRRTKCCCNREVERTQTDVDWDKMIEEINRNKSAEEPPDGR